MAPFEAESVGLEENMPWPPPSSSLLPSFGDDIRRRKYLCVGQIFAVPYQRFNLEPRKLYTGSMLNRHSDQELIMGVQRAARQLASSTRSERFSIAFVNVRLRSLSMGGLPYENNRDPIDYGKLPIL
ncbi:hypothetical protein ACOME3_007135 [Neoechinorhynchus agilis]